MLLLGTAVGCDNGAPDNLTPLEQTSPPEAERITELDAPIADQSSTPDTTQADLPRPAVAKGQTLQATPETKAETETKAEVSNPERQTEKEAEKAQTAKAQTAGTEGETSRATDLKAAPQLDGQRIRALAASTGLLIFERQGGWYRVSVGNDHGWVRMLHVTRTAGSGIASAGSELATVAVIATGREGMGNVAATTGIRGLNEEALKTAEPDMARLQELDSHGVSRTEAAQVAVREGLTSRTIAYLKQAAK
jgi:hypothetical protein